MRLADRIEQKMTEHPFIAIRTMPVQEAAGMMKQAGIRHLPVVEDGKVVGVLSDRDLRQALAFAGQVPLFVADVMTQEPYCVKVGTLLSSVAKEMAVSKFGCAVVLNDWNRVVGIFTTTDGMRILGEILAREPETPFHMLGVEKFLSPSFLA